MNCILQGQIKSNFTQEIADERYLKITEKGSSNGVASLDNYSKIHLDQIPSLNYVPITRQINNKSLSEDITLSADDVNAISKTDILSISQGGTGVSNMVGTDYTINRPRGIILQDTDPSSVANGCLVGVYE